MKEFNENITIAFRSIRGQLLRTILTILIISFGIMALVGMLTSIDVLEQNLSSSFQLLGSNTFTISQSTDRHRGPRAKKAPNRVITFEEATLFKERYLFPSTVSISSYATSTGIIKYAAEKTQPNIPVVGGDENYLTTGGFEIDKGRNFSVSEMQTGADVAIIGEDIVDGLFKGTNPVEQFISVGNRRYLVVGTLKAGGSGINTGRDRTVIIPITNLRAYYGGASTSYAISIMVPQPNMMDMGIEEATGVFRAIRSVPIGMEPNFEFERSDSIVNTIMGITGNLAFGAIIISLITLLGAVTGLVNIMLISVNERTREIGVRKALGAKRKNILIQFLLEAILICQLGGILGAFLGMLNGNALTLIMGGTFVIPWMWIILAILICFAVGITAGVYPAIKASKLDPVDALRYE